MSPPFISLSVVCHQVLLNRYLIGHGQGQATFYPNISNVSLLLSTREEKSFRNSLCAECFGVLYFFPAEEVRFILPPFLPLDLRLTFLSGPRRALNLFLFVSLLPEFLLLYIGDDSGNSKGAVSI